VGALASLPGVEACCLPTLPRRLRATLARVASPRVLGVKPEGESEGEGEAEAEGGAEAGAEAGAEGGRAYLCLRKQPLTLFGSCRGTSLSPVE
jgi:hypothetical protein